MAKYIYICSPCRGDYENNIENAITYCAAAFSLGFIPIAPHIYFTAFLNDVGFERDFGIEAGHLFMRQCDRAVCAVIDGRISEGMRSDIDYATTELALEVEYLRFTKMQAMDYIEAMESEMKQYGAEAEHR